MIKLRVAAPRSFQAHFHENGHGKFILNTPLSISQFKTVLQCDIRREASNITLENDLGKRNWTELFAALSAAVLAQTCGAAAGFGSWRALLLTLMSEWQHWQWQADSWMMWDWDARLRAASLMMWDSEQEIGAAEHMPASASLREYDGDGESEGGEWDIAAELKHIAAGALAVIKDVIQSAGVLQVILAPIEQTLIDLNQTPADVLARPTLDEDFEVRLAQAVIQVDRLLPNQVPPCLCLP